METYPEKITLEDVENALTLLERRPSGNPFFFPGQPIPTSVAFKQGSETLIDKAKLTILRFEEGLARVFGLSGSFVPDDLLKECQSRLLKAQKTETAHTPETESVKKELGLLSRIHRSRRSSALSYARAQNIGTWKLFEPEDPSKFRQRRNGDFGHRFWALIIGNNDYPTTPLRGCINDGALIQAYLLEYLDVPADHITFLKNATRDQMVNGLYDLRDNVNIARNDNILIHYSGHGTSYHTGLQTFGESAGTVDGICPVDRGPSIPDISDRELVSILYELQREKGNNITLIMDCCNSSGTIRSPNVSSGEDTIRYIVPLGTTEQESTVLAMLTASDNNPRRRPDTPLILAENWIDDAVDFVQLVACKDLQVAREGLFLTESPSSAGPAKLETGDYSLSAEATDREDAPSSRRQYGYFTWALVSVLKSKVGRTGTYEGVIEAIGKLGDMQDTTAAGRRKGSMLWYNDC